MDTSETYIKMRLAAIPYVGEGVPPQIGIDNNDNTLDPEWLTQQVFVDIKGDFYYVAGVDHCQLERQDQLQAMVYGLPFESSLAGLKIPEKSDMWTVLPHLLSFAYNWEFKEDTIVLTQGANFYSMEQLWLAFVVKTRWNKVWSGTDWVALK